MYLPPTSAMETLARSATPAWRPSLPSRGTWASNAQGRRYGFWTFGDYFTPRQLVALTTFSDLVGEAMERIRRDAVAAGLSDDDRPLRDGGTGGRALCRGCGAVSGVCGGLRSELLVDDDRNSGSGVHSRNVRSSSSTDDMGLRGGSAIRDNEWELDWLALAG